MDALGFETGFCHFCRYETATKPYPIGPFIFGPEDIEKTEDGHYKREPIWLCDFCCMLSCNDMKDKSLRALNWGLNHILKRLAEK
jgi:hypothetical protein